VANWKNRDSKLQQRRDLKRQKKFYGETTAEKARKIKAVIREQKQEKEDSIEKFWDET
jgi:hypothetical protein